MKMDSPECVHGWSFLNPQTCPDCEAQEHVERAIGTPPMFRDSDRRNGHPRFYELTKHEEDMHSRKNSDYAGGGRPMGNFERVSQILKLYPGFPLDTPYGVSIVYTLKQFDAAMWLLCTGREGQVEGIADRLGDISVYAKLIRIMYEERNK